MDAVMRLLADPAEAFAQYGWYLVGAAVVYFYVLRPYVDGEVARRKLAEANDPSRRRALDEKRAAAIADRQASLDKAAKERPPPPKPKPKPKPKPTAPAAFGGGGGPLMGHRGGGSSYQRPNPRSRRPGGGGG